MQKLDSFTNRIIGSISFIKIDVEGHELNVLKGGENLIKQYRPTIFVEILRENWIDNKPGNSESAQFMKSLGYNIEQVQKGRKESINEKFNPKFQNFLFTIN